MSSDIDGNLFMSSNDKSFSDIQLDSSNFGKTWTLATNKTDNSFYTAAVSSSGQYQTTADYLNGNIYISSDYGINWTLAATENGNQFRATAMSSSGQYQLVVDVSGNIYNSSNYGKNWELSYTFTGEIFYEAAMSSSGQYQTIVSNNSGNIYAREHL